MRTSSKDVSKNGMVPATALFGGTYRGLGGTYGDGGPIQLYLHRRTIDAVYRRRHRLPNVCFFSFNEDDRDVVATSGRVFWTANDKLYSDSFFAFEPFSFLIDLESYQPAR